MSWIHGEVKKFCQSARPFGEFKTVQNFVDQMRRAAADHVTHMFLGQFVFGQIAGGLKPLSFSL